MINSYGGDSTPWPLPTPFVKKEIIEEAVQDLIEGRLRPSIKDIAIGALLHLEKHPDAALLAYRLLSQRFAISE